MSKLTIRDRETLRNILQDAERAEAYLFGDKIRVCRVDQRATTTLHFTRQYMPGVDRAPENALPLYPVAKDIGSDLCRLGEATRALARFLSTH